jgi:hypothetical protein
LNHLAWCLRVLLCDVAWTFNVTSAEGEEVLNQ